MLPSLILRRSWKSLPSAELTAADIDSSGHLPWHGDPWILFLLIPIANELEVFGSWEPECAGPVECVLLTACSHMQILRTQGRTGSAVRATHQKRLQPDRHWQITSKIWLNSRLL